MLNYKNTTLIFILTMAVMIFAGLYRAIPMVLYLAPAAVYAGLLVYGSSYIRSGFFMEVLCQGDRNHPEVALTFDDGPSEKNTPLILDILKQNNVPATFFCIGKMAEALPGLVKRLHEEGHIAGNHSYSHHFFFDFFTQNGMGHELMHTNQVIRKIINQKPALFRPPYGVTTPVLAKVVRKLRMTPVGWSLRTLDTVIKSPGKLVQKINEELMPGDVILLHDTGKFTAESLQQIIDVIHQKGFRIVRVDRLLNRNAYA